MLRPSTHATLSSPDRLENTMDDAPILIRYDGSNGARDAITSAASFLAGRHAVVLDVAPVVTVAESYAAFAPMTPSFDELNREDAMTRARAGAELARKVGFDAEPRADVAAPAWDGIVEVADEIAAAVIVIGSRGLGGARELFEGSMSHEVAEHAGRPVLIVPPARVGAKHQDSTVVTAMGSDGER
jgi:nucleotide-binding universal stress UspA family protein